MSSGIIRDWVPGDSFSAGHLTEPLPTVRSVRTITGDNGIEVTQTEAGTAISLPENLSVAPAPYFLCLIVNKGPNSEADYTDARYWVRIAEIPSGNIADAVQIYGLTAPPSPLGTTGPNGAAKAYPDIITATNINELTGGASASTIHTTVSPAGSHSLQTDETRVVRVFAVADQGGIIRYFFEAVNAPVLLKITGTTWTDSSALGGGKYRARIFSAPITDNSKGTDLAEADLGTTGTTDVLALNRREVGLSTHKVALSSFLPLLFEATLLRTNTDGTQVYSFDGIQSEAC